MKTIRMQIANAAFSFFEIGEKAYNDALAIIKSDTEAGFYGILPGIVNLSLSIELFIKSFLEPKAKYRTHNLKMLFDELEEPEKSLIQQAVIREYSQYQADFDDTKFVDLLENNKEAFEDWRYYYERGDHSNPTFIYCMANVLNSVAHRFKDALTSTRLLT